MAAHKDDQGQKLDSSNQKLDMWKENMLYPSRIVPRPDFEAGPAGGRTRLVAVEGPVEAEADPC